MVIKSWKEDSNRKKNGKKIIQSKHLNKVNFFSLLLSYSTIHAYETYKMIKHIVCEFNDECMYNA